MKAECQACIYWKDSGSSYGYTKEGDSINWGECLFNPPVGNIYHYLKQGKPGQDFTRFSLGPSGAYGAEEELSGFTALFPRTWANDMCYKFGRSIIKSGPGFWVRFCKFMTKKRHIMPWLEKKLK